MKQRIGIVGAGNMGEAIAGALVRSRVIDPSDILVTDISLERLEWIRQTYAIGSMETSAELLSVCDAVVLAVKPQQLIQTVSQMISEGDLLSVKGRRLFISIAAGIRMEKLESVLYSSLGDAERSRFPVVRVMPNTPSLVLAGMAGMSGNTFATEADMGLVKTIFEAMGRVVTVKETELDALTAMSGSGPAYLFYFVEAMMAAGQSLGFDESTARELTVETFKGALRLMEDSGESPASLRCKVTSPGGTTQAALEIMENSGVGTAIRKAVQGAARRSEELSR